jgi:glycosyltransferase involved in cell wall biosynthesis
MTALSEQRTDEELAATRDRHSVEGSKKMQDQPTVSIIIKALNEERHIAGVIESALATLSGVDAELILADAASTDRTIEIARRYPVKIVRLNNTADRSCGAGAQLGFQHSTGRYLWLIDADMRLHAGFLPAAIRFLEEHPDVAGVGGLNFERNTSNLEFEQRANRRDPDRAPGYITRLNGTGLYRRSAIEAIGYLTDRNLHGGEELDLGARLHARGWRLARIDRPAVDHYGHSGNAYRLLLRRLASRNALGAGELFRGAIGQPHFWFVVRHDRNFWLCCLIAGWWLGMAGAATILNGVHAIVAIVALLLCPILAMSLRWRSLRHGLYSVAAWNVFAFGFVPGALRPRVSPSNWIDSTIVEPGPGPIKQRPAAVQQDPQATGTISPQAV